MRFRFVPLALAVLCAGAHADSLDDVIHAEMKRRQIPGLSIAVIDGGKVVRAQGYGVTEKNGGAAVTPATLFQAGSVSKSVAALGALRLAEQGKLALDEDVNARLVSWKVADNEFTAEKKVTLRGLLSHTAGLTVHGFPGYALDAPMPTVVQVLNGEAPANTRPVRVHFAPGSQWRYSGGGYTVMQLLMTDVTGKPFAELMRDSVLAPLGMHASSFEQPPTAEHARLAATGHYGDRKQVRGRWHIYPEMAAAGLWSTPSDLARFAIGIQQALAGAANSAISAAMAREMLTDQKNNYGLGVFLKGAGKDQQFSHGGRDEGFDALMSAYSHTGQGVVVMINANDNSRIKERIVAAVARQYRWPGAAEQARVAAPAKIDARTLARYAGWYEIANNRMIAFTAQHGRLSTLVDGMPDEEFIPIGKGQFRSNSRKMELSFVSNARGHVTAAAMNADGQQRQVPRIGPLMRSLTAQADRQPARTATVKTVLDAAARGGDALAESALATPGLKKNFGTDKVEELSGLSSLAFLHEQDVADGSLQRHGGKVARVLSYVATIDGQPRYLMVYLTADGVVTDYDLVAH
ncbi:MAG: serine hydrolase domain-containing protein [Pseudomonadota bacterium]